MVDTSTRVNRYTGRWYSYNEAQDIETDLQLNSGTGDTWNWVNIYGNQIAFSGRARPEQINMPPEKIPAYGKARERYFKNKFK